MGRPGAVILISRPQGQLRGCTQALAERAREAAALRGRLARQEGALAERAAALAQCRGELARLRGLLEERDRALVVSPGAAVGWGRPD